MKRFSKIVSVMTEVPSACVSIAIICACKSVGNPGYGSVRSSTDLSLSRARDAEALAVGLDRDAGLAQLGRDRFEMLDRRVGNRHVAAGDRRRRHHRAGLDSVGNHFMLGAMQPLDAFDFDYVRAGAADLRAHR